MPRHSAGWRLTAGILAIAALSVFAVSCNERGNPPHIAQFGDSLSWEAEGYYTWLIRASRETALTYDSVGGTAICDWLPRMREVEAAHHPTEVELEFSGNSLTSCMHGYPYGSHAYYNKYRADTLEAISIFAPPGGAPAHVFLVGGPITRPQQSNPDWDKLNLQYAEIAAADPQHVSYVDAGTAVEGPDHTYSHTLACLPVEPCNGPPVNGVPSNIVRSPDGTHFCPDKSGAANGVVDRCPVYSSGAFRYAEAMVDPLEKPPAPFPTFTLRPGAATDIGVGANGSVWIVGTNPVAGGYGIYRWTGSGWTPVPGGATRIAVDPSGNPWVVNSAGQIYNWVGNPWVVNSAGQIYNWVGNDWVVHSGAATDIGVGADGSVWIVGTNPVAGGYGIYTWTGPGLVPVPGGAVVISVGPSGNPWVVNSAGQIYSS